MMMTFLPVARIDSPLIAVAEAAAVLLGQEGHRRLDPLEVAPGDVEVARPRGADGQEQGVVALAELARVDRPPDLRVQDEPDALGLELVDPPVDVDLGHLEVGDAVESAARPAGRRARRR